MLTQLAEPRARTLRHRGRFWQGLLGWGRQRVRLGTVGEQSPLGCVRPGECRARGLWAWGQNSALASLRCSATSPSLWLLAPLFLSPLVPCCDWYWPWAVLSAPSHLSNAYEVALLPSPLTRKNKKSGDIRCPQVAEPGFKPRPKPGLAHCPDGSRGPTGPGRQLPSLSWAGWVGSTPPGPPVPKRHVAGATWETAPSLAIR